MNMQSVGFGAFAGSERVFCCSQFTPAKNLIAQPLSLLFVNFFHLENPNTLLKRVNNCHFSAVAYPARSERESPESDFR